jgi:PhzF family phenazine biosynthesis protein
MTNSLEIFHLDIFSSKPFYGNPLAVIRQSSTQVLTTKSMQQVANWLNLSETTFLAANPMHPDADYSIRIFTTSRELPFAGHPTIGSCKAWLVSGGIPKNPNFIIQECGKGLIKLKVDRDIISFEAPELNQSGPLEESELDIIARGLGIFFSLLSEKDYSSVPEDGNGLRHEQPSFYFLSATFIGSSILSSDGR